MCDRRRGYLPSRRSPTGYVALQTGLGIEFGAFERPRDPTISTKMLYNRQCMYIATQHVRKTESKTYRIPQRRTTANGNGIRKLFSVTARRARQNCMPTLDSLKLTSELRLRLIFQWTQSDQIDMRATDRLPGGVLQ